MRLRFVIFGEPMGKGRPKFARIGQGVRAYTPKETVQYENLIRAEYIRQCKNYRFPDKMPVDMRIIAYYGIPRSASKRKRMDMLEQRVRPIKKVDWDNLGKIIADSLNGVAYKDDVQVVDAQVRKFYSERPRVVVSLQEAATVQEVSTNE